MAKKIINPRYEQEKQLREQQLQRELAEEQEEQTLVQKYGFGFTNGYGQMSDEQFMRQFREQFIRGGMTKSDAERESEALLEQMYQNYNDLYQAFGDNNMLDSDGKLAVPDNVQQIVGPVSFDETHSISQNVADYREWYDETAGLTEREVMQEDVSFDPHEGYAAFSAEIDARDAESLAKRKLLDDDYTTSHDEPEEVYDEDLSLMDPMPDLADEEMEDMFQEELQRYANGQMSDFEKQMFQNSVADGTFGQKRMEHADKLDYLANGVKVPAAQIPAEQPSGLAAAMKRGMPDAIAQMPGGFDPEYTNERGVPDALKQGIQGSQPGIDYEVE